MEAGAVRSWSLCVAVALCLCLCFPVCLGSSGASSAPPAAADKPDLPALLKKLENLPEAEKIPVLNQIAEAFLFQKDFEEAARRAEHALALAQARNNAWEIARAQLTIGSAYYGLGKHSQALDHLRACSAELTALENTPGGVPADILLEARSAIARIDIDLNRVGEAQKTMEPALAYIEKVEDPKERSAAYGLLADVYERRGEPGRALVFLRKASDLKEHILKEEGSRRLLELQARYVSEKEKQENALLAKKSEIIELALKRQTGIRHSLMSLSALVLLVAALIFNRYRLKVLAHRQLELAHAKITAQKDELDLANIRLEALSRKDPLTELSNRRDMEEKFEDERIRFDRTGRPFALIMADIDRFKTVNDTYGHECGDFVLKTLARVLRMSLRRLTWIGRWGGDEFLLLLPETNLAGARRVVEKIRDRIARTTFSWDGRELEVRLSLGVSFFQEGMEIEDLLREADQDMYRKKRAAKARAAGLPS